MRRVGIAILLGALSGRLQADAVVPYLAAGSVPEGGVAVIDPASGTSSGSPGSEVRLATGDVVPFRFAVVPLPGAAARGLQSWVTVYLPTGTELVGARILDVDGNTVEPRRAGLALDGCGGGSTCNAAPAGQQTGSIAQLYADTGVFYTTVPLAGARTPDDELLTLANGVAMSPEPARIDPEMATLLGASGGTYFTHDLWDWDQVRAFGTTSSPVSDGDGNTPYRYGSPVAGPDTFYRYEVTGSDLLNVVGPWQRIAYPGSQIGVGVGDIGSTSNMTRVGVDTSAGWDLQPASAVPAKAVRFALGEARVGEPRIVEVALRVTGVPIDPAYGATGGNVLCAEAIGGAVSSKAANSGGNTNPWPHYLPHPQCVLVRAKLDAAADRAMALPGDTVAYTLSGRNLSVADETGATLVAKFATADQALVDASPSPDQTAACAPPDTDRTCLTWNLGTLAPSDSFRVALRLTVLASGATRNVLLAEYRSNELSAIEPRGATASAVTVVQATAAPRLTLANALDPTANSAAPGSGTWRIDGTIVNEGTTAWTQENLTLFLPTGWRVTGGVIHFDGADVLCSGTGCGNSSAPTFIVSRTYAVGQARTFWFQVTNNVGSTGSGLFPVGVRAWGSQASLGSFETDAPKATAVPVGATRTARPAVTCPVEPSQGSVSGTSEPNAAIQVLLNGSARGTATADAGGAWTSTDVSGFGAMYAGLEVRATAQAPGKLRSEPSPSCTVGRRLPGEVTGLSVSRAGGVAELAWLAPSEGGDPAAFRYDVVRTGDPSDFVATATCLESNDGPATTASDPTDPAPGAAFHYLVRARNLWGPGPLGRASSGGETSGRSCP